MHTIGLIDKYGVNYDCASRTSSTMIVFTIECGQFPNKNAEIVVKNNGNRTTTFTQNGCNQMEYKTFKKFEGDWLFYALLVKMSAQQNAIAI